MSNGLTSKASKAVWKERAEQMLADNLMLQKYGKKATEDLMMIHKIVVEQHEKMRMLLMPGVKDALMKVAVIAGPYCIQVPDIKVGLKKPDAKDAEITPLPPTPYP